MNIVCNLLGLYICEQARVVHIFLELKLRSYAIVLLDEPKKCKPLPSLSNNIYQLIASHLESLQHIPFNTLISTLTFSFVKTPFMHQNEH